MRSLHALFVVFALLLGAAPAVAEEAAGPAHTHNVRSAKHIGEWTEAGTRWRTRFIPDSLPYVHADGNRLELLVEFARPLPAETAVTPAPSAVVELHRNEAGEIVTARVSGPPDAGWGTFVTFLEFETATPEPPVVAKIPQQVELRGARFDPASTDTPMKPRLRDIRHEALTERDISQLEARWGDPDGAARPIRLVADAAYLESGGLAPHLVHQDEVRSQNFWLLGGLFALVLIALAVVIRLVSKAARAEEAEAFLATFDLEADHEAI